MPLKERIKDDAVAINGTDLSDHCQLHSGIAVPRFVAKKSGLLYIEYTTKR